MRRTALITAFCFAAACGTDPAAPPGDSSTLMGPASGAVSGLSLCAGKTAEPKLAPVYNCLDTVFVDGADDALSTAITTAVNRWRVVLGQNNLPVFVTSGHYDRRVPVTWAGPVDGLWICGNGFKGQQAITVTRSLSSANCGGELSTNPIQKSRLADLISHELSHTFGFGHLSQLGSVPAVDHCTASLPDQGGLNTSLCLAEIIKIQYHYGMRGDIDISKPILTRISVAGPTSVVRGSTVTLAVDELMFDGGAAPSNPLGVKFQWSSADPDIATTSATATPSNVITGVAEGVTEIRVRLNDARYQTADPGDQTEIPFTVNAPPTAPPAPTSLTASEISFTSARVSWTNGTTGVTTTVQYRKNGTTGWTTFGTTGATTDTITGLTGATKYDVRIYHTKSGLIGPPLIRNGLFTTLDPSIIPPISNFTVIDCRQEPAGGKTYNFFTMGWTSPTSPPGSSFQIGVNSTSSSAGATILVTVPGSQRQAEVGSWVSSSVLLSRWFWIRYSGGPWTALVGNPLAANQCAQ